MYNLIKYSDVYSKTSGRSWQYYRQETALDGNKNIIGFPVDNNNNNNSNNNNNNNNNNKK